MVSFKLSFCFCEFFIIKVGLHISDLDMSIFGVKLFDIYLESKKVLFFIQQKGKWGTGKLLTPLRSTEEQSLNILVGRGLCSFFKDYFLLIIKKLQKPIWRLQKCRQKKLQCYHSAMTIIYILIYFLIIFFSMHIYIY